MPWLAEVRGGAARELATTDPLPGRPGALRPLLRRVANSGGPEWRLLNISVLGRCCCCQRDFTTRMAVAVALIQKRELT